MTITKSEFLVLKQAAGKLPELNHIVSNIENRSTEQNKKNTAYILEKRKTNKYYCR